MNAPRERAVIRVLHLLLSIPILGYLYGPVASIPPAARFTRWVAMPVVVLSGLWLWLKPRIIQRVHQRRVRLGSDGGVKVVYPVRSAKPSPTPASVNQGNSQSLSRG